MYFLPWNETLSWQGPRQRSPAADSPSQGVQVVDRVAPAPTAFTTCPAGAPHGWLRVLSVLRRGLHGLAASACHDGRSLKDFDQALCGRGQWRVGPGDDGHVPTGHGFLDPDSLQAADLREVADQQGIQRIIIKYASSAGTVCFYSYNTNSKITRLLHAIPCGCHAPKQE